MEIKQKIKRKDLNRTEKYLISKAAKIPFIRRTAKE